MCSACNFDEALPGEADRQAAVFDVEAGLEGPKAISPRPWSVIVSVADQQRSR